MSECLICRGDTIIEPLNVDSDRQAHSSCIEHLQEEGWTMKQIEELIRQRKKEQET